MAAQDDPDYASIESLPLVEKISGKPGPLLAIFITGDGGWRRIDERVTEGLNEQGIDVVGFNSPAYFRTLRTPEETAGDVAAVLRFYEARTGRRDFVMVGYSRGADVLPFVMTRLPADLAARVRVVALLGLEKDIEFEVHPLPWFGRADPPLYDVRREVEKLAGRRILCVKGKHESESICPQIQSLAHVVVVPGAHHFKGDYRRVARLVGEAATE